MPTVHGGEASYYIKSNALHYQFPFMQEIFIFSKYFNFHIVAVHPPASQIGAEVCEVDYTYTLNCIFIFCRSSSS